MGIHAAAKNAMLGGLPSLFVGGHTAWPGDAGSNEVSGGAYARKSATFGAASAGARAASNAPVLDIPAGTTLVWLSYWDALTTGNLLISVPVGGQAPFEFIVDTSAETINAPAHGLSNGQQVVFHGGTPPGGLIEGTIYFVVGAATDTFQVAATAGGSAINLTSQAAAACLAQRIIPETFASAGTYTVTQAGSQIDLNR